MIAQDLKENTEPSLRGNSLEGVETEARTCGKTFPMVIMGRFYSVTNKRERRATQMSRRYSPNLLVTVGVEANSTQPLSKDKSNKFDQDGLEQIQREQDKVWKRLVDAAQSVYNDSFLFNTLNVRAAA